MVMRKKIATLALVCMIFGACAGTKPGTGVTEPSATSTAEPSVTTEIKNTTSTAENTPEPTSAPEATSIPGPTSTPEATSIPGPTSTPEATSIPEPTSTPETTSIPGPTSTPEAASTPEPTSTSVPTSTPTPIAEARKVDFDKEFTVEVNETVYLKDNVTFEITEIYAFDGVDPGNHFSANYSMSDEDGVYKGGMHFYRDGSRENWDYAETYNPYKLVVKSVDAKTVSVEISDRLPKATALVLSGNEEDIYTADNYTYVETDKCILYIDKGMSVRGNVMEWLAETIDAVERETGMSFYNNSVRNDLNVSNIRECYFDGDPWPGIDEESKKVSFYLVQDREQVGWVSCSMFRAQVITHWQYDVNKPDRYVFAHELVHGVESVNYHQADMALVEGYATFIGERVTQSFGENGWIDMYYYMLDEDVFDFINSNTAEEFFTTKLRELDYDYNYSFGLALHTFIEEQYGKEGYKKFLAAFTDEIEALSNKGRYPDSQKLVELNVKYLKKELSEKFFEDFGKWYETYRKTVTKR